MQIVFPLAGALLILLDVVAALNVQTKRCLPLGGSHIAQIAVVFGLAFVIYEVGMVLNQ